MALTSTSTTTATTTNPPTTIAMPRQSLNPRSIERTLRVQDFLKNDKASAFHQEPAQQGKTQTADEEDLDTFMDSVTDKKLVKEAKDSWQK